jgi:hypothetical protein
MVARVYHHPCSTVGVGKMARMVMRQLWEYAIVSIGISRQLMIAAGRLEEDRIHQAESKPRDKTEIDLINQMGSEAWELVSAVDIKGTRMVLYFKRPIE